MSQQSEYQQIRTDFDDFHFFKYPNFTASEEHTYSMKEIIIILKIKEIKIIFLGNKIKTFLLPAVMFELHIIRKE